MARRRWQIDFKNILTGERETPGIKCYKSYKSYKVYKFYNALFKWRGKEQLSNLHRWNAVFALNLNLEYENQNGVSRLRLWRVLTGTLLRLFLRCLCDEYKHRKLVLARCGFVSHTDTNHPCAIASCIGRNSLHGWRKFSNKAKCSNKAPYTLDTPPIRRREDAWLTRPILP